MITEPRKKQMHGVCRCVDTSVLAVTVTATVVEATPNCLFSD
jgi:hypothetical protein